MSKEAVSKVRERVLALGSGTISLNVFTLLKKRNSYAFFLVLCSLINKTLIDRSSSIPKKLYHFHFYNVY